MKKSLANHAITFIRTIFTMMLLTYVSGFVSFVIGMTLFWMSFAMYGFLWIPYVGPWLIANSGWFQAIIYPIIIQFCMGYMCMYLTLTMIKTKNRNSNVYVILTTALLTYIVYGFYMHSAVWFYSRLFGSLAGIEMVLLFIYFRGTNKIVVPQPKAIHKVTPPPPPPMSHS